MLRRLPLRPLGVISRSRRVEHILASLVGFVFVIWWVSYGSSRPLPQLHGEKPEYMLNEGLS